MCVTYTAPAGAAVLKATARIKAGNTPVEIIYCWFILVLLLKFSAPKKVMENR
jgi:hypothetical protein